jgi:hypothetical protein
LVQIWCLTSGTYRDKKVVGVFIAFFIAPLHLTFVAGADVATTRSVVESF